jgi:hypothetical protein
VIECGIRNAERGIHVRTGEAAATGFLNSPPGQEGWRRPRRRGGRSDAVRKTALVKIAVSIGRGAPPPRPSAAPPIQEGSLDEGGTQNSGQPQSGRRVHPALLPQTKLLTSSATNANLFATGVHSHRNALRFETPSLFDNSTAEDQPRRTGQNPGPGVPTLFTAWDRRPAT